MNNQIKQKNRVKEKIVRTRSVSSRRITMTDEERVNRIKEMQRIKNQKWREKEKK